MVVWCVLAGFTSCSLGPQCQDIFVAHAFTPGDLQRISSRKPIFVSFFRTMLNSLFWFWCNGSEELTRHFSRIGLSSGIVSKSVLCCLYLKQNVSTHTYSTKSSLRFCGEQTRHSHLLSVDPQPSVKQTCGCRNIQSLVR